MTGLPDEARFWALVDKRGEDECWPWRGRVHRRTQLPQIAFRGRTYPAFKVAYALHTGRMPARLWHSCFTLNCMNPRHGTETHPKHRRIE